MPGAHCAIVGCTNGEYKLQQWKTKKCQQSGLGLRLGLRIFRRKIACYIGTGPTFFYS